MKGMYHILFPGMCKPNPLVLKEELSKLPSGSLLAPNGATFDDTGEAWEAFGSRGGYLGSFATLDAAILAHNARVRARKQR